MDEATLLVSKLETVDSEMVTYDRSISPLDAAVVDLDHNQYTLKTNFNAISPFLAKLPLELILNVFDLVNESQPKGSPHLFPSPLLLGKICTAWRNIAWTTPRLWSLLSIHLRTTDNAKISIQKELLEEWFDRSGDYPLHCEITFETAVHPSASITNILFKTCSRWKSLTIRPFPAFAKELEKRHSFPNLNYVRINASGCRNDGVHLDFSKPPLLRRIKFTGSNPLSIVTFRWEQLIAVNMSISSQFQYALAMIHRLTAAQTLRLWIKASAHILPAIVPRNLPDLSFIEIIASTPSICSLLQAMTTPRLTALKITPRICGDGSWARAIEQLHQRSLFSLSYLFLERVDIGEREMLSMLESFASLRSFSLSTSQKFDLSNAMIIRLDPSNRDPNSYFLPSLTKFDYNGPISFTIKALEDMLEQRLFFSESQEDKFNKVKAFQQFEITYKNSSWVNDAERTDQLQAFQEKINNLKSRGTTLNLVPDKELKPDLN